MLFLHVMLVFIKCRGSWKTSAPHQFFHLRNNTYYRQAWLTKKNRTSPTKVQNVDYPCYTGYSHMEMGGIQQSSHQEPKKSTVITRILW